MSEHQHTIDGPCLECWAVAMTAERFSGPVPPPASLTDTAREIAERLVILADIPHHKDEPT